MFRLCILFSLFNVAVSFSEKINIKPKVDFKYYGDIKPTNYFDPLKISSSLTPEGIKYVREAELQHCRVAMVGILSLVTLDAFREELSVHFLSNLDISTQTPYWLGVSAFEFTRMGAGWKNPFTENKSNYFKLDSHYQPGNVFKLNKDAVSQNLYEAELSNGRLAMIGCLGYIAQELVTGAKIF